MIEVKMPKWGLTMEEGVVNSWFKQVGDPVEEGEVLAELDVDKTNAELESPGTGILAEIKVEEGEEVEVGQLLAIIMTEEEWKNKNG